VPVTQSVRLKHCASNARQLKPHCQHRGSCCHCCWCCPRWCQPRRQSWPKSVTSCARSICCSCLLQAADLRTASNILAEFHRDGREVVPGLSQQQCRGLLPLHEATTSTRLIATVHCILACCNRSPSISLHCCWGTGAKVPGATCSVASGTCITMITSEIWVKQMMSSALRVADTHLVRGTESCCAQHGASVAP
jgi:hypothetical protein